MATLKKFTNGLRVKIVDHGSQPELNGRVGTVVRLLISASDAAWINMDEPLPDKCRVFPADDRRGNHTKVYLDECEKV